MTVRYKTIKEIKQMISQKEISNKEIIGYLEGINAPFQSLEDEEKTHCTDCASTCLSNKLRES